MIISNEFSVARPIDETWLILTDLEGIAPCMPGAQLTEVEGDVYRGIVKVKLGPIQARFKGEASFTEQDAEEHRAVLSARGKEASGKGVASATVTAQLKPGEEDGTTLVTVDTELNISGKIAQFGRSAMSDVSEKLMGQFAQNLEEKLGETQEADASAAGDGDGRAAAAADEEASAAVDATTDGEVSAAEEGAGTSPGTTTEVSPDGEAEATRASSEGAADKEPETSQRRVIDSPEAEPVDLVRTAGAPLSRMLIPALLVIVVIVIIVVLVM